MTLARCTFTDTSNGECHDEAIQEARDGNPPLGVEGDGGGERCRGRSVGRQLEGARGPPGRSTSSCGRITCPPAFSKSFEEKTGIKVNYPGIGSNEEIINKMKATKGRGFDLMQPRQTCARSQWVPAGADSALRHESAASSNLGSVNGAMLQIGEVEWELRGEVGSHWLPHIWGTEGDRLADGSMGAAARMRDIPSYGNIWQPEVVKGKTMMPPPLGNAGRGSLHGDSPELARAEGDMLARLRRAEDTMRPRLGRRSTSSASTTKSR